MAIPLKKARPKNLADLIDSLQTPEVSNNDLRELLLRFITEVPLDDPNSPYAAKAKVRLDALGMLIKLNALEQKANTNVADVIQLLGEADEEDQE